MNKQIPQGNKIIYQKMYRKERMRQLNRLHQIKAKPGVLHPQEHSNFRQTSLFDSQRNLEIERKNIALFNKYTNQQTRIASIIKEKPRLQFPKSRSYVQSLDQALFRHEKKMLDLKQKNQNIIKRLNKQQPTIKNDQIMKDRMRNEQYLSFIGRYPFKRTRRTQTQYQIAKDDRQLVFHQRTLDFDISIHHRPEDDDYQFVVKDLLDNKQYRLKMEGPRFKEQLAVCNLSYEQMVGKLRMEKSGQMVYTNEQLNKTAYSSQKET